MSTRLLYMKFTRGLASLASRARTSAVKDAELNVRRYGVAVLRRTNPKPNWTDRALLAAFARLLAPGDCRRGSSHQGGFALARGTGFQH